MKVTVFSTHPFERPYLEAAAKRAGHDFFFLDSRLTPETARLAEGSKVVCSFANDRVDAETIQRLKDVGVTLIALRSAGFNHVDLQAAERLGLQVVRVPAYSPDAIAEHAVCLILALNRRIHRAFNRVRDHNFSLDGLVGFDLKDKTIGVIGTGKIGAVFCRIMAGFGCRVVAYDIVRNEALERTGQVRFVELEAIYRDADVVSLHVPLTPQTRHIIDAAAISKMKRGVMIINTGRGALIETQALIDSLKSGHVGFAGLDVYEEEENVFFRDLSEQVLQDDVLARLLTFPNVLITAHQAFLTQEALVQIAEITAKNISDFERGLPLVNEVQWKTVGGIASQP